jgi:hypothetical protein
MEVPPIQESGIFITYCVQDKYHRNGRKLHAYR